MPGYQHYSFDLWLTLIRSNPAFKAERARHFHRHFNTANKTLEQVQQAFRKVDLLCNAINEKTGGNIDAGEMYLMVIGEINEGTDAFAGIDLDDLFAEMDRLLFNYLPQVYGEGTANVLADLRARDGVTLNILSNTGFIRGSALRPVLGALGLEPYFDFQMYSDEEGRSKPCDRLFARLLHRIDETKGRAIERQRILHVGDNPRADVHGARRAGIGGLLINSNEDTITKLLSL